MTQAVLHQLQLAVRSAEHGNVGEGTVYLPILSLLGVQHVHTAGHPGDLFGQKHSLGKIVSRME